MQNPKAVLAVLLCYVLTASQAFALKGGPPVGTGGGGTLLVDTTGTYSGVLQGLTETTPADPTAEPPPPIPGDPDPTPTTPNNPTTQASTALGLFDLNVTTGGLAQGTFLLFADGRVFSGTINGAADPGTGQLQGVLEGTFNFTLQTTNVTGDLVSIPIVARAVGRLDSVITGPNPASSNALLPGQTASTVQQLTRVNGTASLDVNFGQVDTGTLAPIIARTISFSVTGVRGSTNTTTATTTLGTTG